MIRFPNIFRRAWNDCLILLWRNGRSRKCRRTSSAWKVGFELPLVTKNISVCWYPFKLDEQLKNNNSQNLRDFPMGGTRRRTSTEDGCSSVSKDPVNTFSCWQRGTVSLIVGVQQHPCDALAPSRHLLLISFWFIEKDNPRTEWTNTCWSYEKDNCKPRV